MRLQELKTEAEAGNIISQGILGAIYLYGLDEVPKDYAAALYWLTPPARRGASRPTFHLGRMHEEGWDVPVDYEQAGSFYQRAADRGEWLAYVHLARLHRYGREKTVDEPSALYWYRIAVCESKTITPCPELEEAREYVTSHHDTDA